MDNIILIVANTITTMLVLSYFSYVVIDTKHKTTDQLVMRFSKGLINLFKLLSICLGTILLFIAVITILSLIEPEWIKINNASDDLLNMIGVFIVIFIVFLITSYYYLFLKKKVIILKDNNFIYKSLFKRTLIFDIKDIESMRNFVDNKIILTLKSKKKVSIDYQLDNFKEFENILKSNNIK